jgi:hypothetical protein
MPSPPDPLVKPTELPRFGVSRDFLAEFLHRPFQVQISTSGDLGAMGYQWRQSSSDSWSVEYKSSAGSTWSDERDENFATLTFATAYYVEASVFLIDAAGVVTWGGGAADATTLTATVYDLPTNACSSVTSEALYLMEDAVDQPLTAWGDDVRQHVADWVFAILKRGRGATPQGGGLGDENIFLAEQAAKDFFRRIGEKGRPESIVDSSPAIDGPMVLYPVSDTPRGW